VAPSVNLGLGSLPPARLKYASGLFNMMRNLGGAVGIAVSAAILNDKTNMHFERIAAHLTPANLPMERLTQGLASRYAALPTGHGVGYQAALEQLWKLSFREASTMAFADTFRTIMLAFVVVTLLVPFFKNTNASTTPPPNAH
jgi:DHA2 family multidrug resistance protein